ncbi:hypothetical protein OEZ86_004654 [Tetradesmus obliquus]|nr:hypothetical protein OEZ86_004654 [Tetradesmus obliquus]
MIRGRHQRTGRPVRAHPTRPSSCTNAAAQSWALRPRHQMQITFAGSPTKLRGLLQQMSEAGLLETTTADTASAGACAAAAAAPDSGCEPNIMTRAQADACQLYYRPLKEGELNIMTIEGNATSCFIGRTDPDPPACSGSGQGIKAEESTTDQGSGTASSTQPVLHFCSSASAEDVLCSMPAPQKATFEYMDNSSCIKQAAAPEAPYHKHGTLHYRLGSIHHSARNFFGFRSTIKVLTLASRRRRRAASTVTAAEKSRVNKRLQYYTWRDGKVLRLMPDNSTHVVPPPSERLQLVKDCHDRTGHFGIRRTTALLLHTWWWHGIQADAASVRTGQAHLP